MDTSFSDAPHTRLRWSEAFRALDRLMKDKDDTVAVFDIMRALEGRSAHRGYARLLSDPKGRTLATERRELAAWLDHAARRGDWPAGTVGAAYRDFQNISGFNAEGLAEVSRIGAQEREDDPDPVAWYGRRMRDIHDLWHVLTGYETDGLGESCVVAFSYSQLGGLGWALITVGSMFDAVLAGRWDAIGAIWQGWRLGRKAAWLPAEDVPTLLQEPLTDARRRLKIGSPTAYLAIPLSRRD